MQKEYDLFLEKCSEFFSGDDIKQIEAAYHFASFCHHGKKRLNKEEYIAHPLAVAEILLDMNVDTNTIIAALLHETINHGGASKDEIEEKFGSEVASLVSSVSKLNRLEFNDDSVSSTNNFRKVVVGMSEDVRVLFIKLADRLQNLRTADALSPSARKKKIIETQKVFIPIAHRLCMYKIKGELENLCLKYTKPDVYNDILERLNATEEELKSNLQEMQESISEMLISHSISFKIKSRVKSVYSIYNKLNNGKKWEQLYDILAMRIIVDKLPECYLAIGLIHAKYRPIPGRFKDYIAMPKKNMYQSLHTGVFGSDGGKYEIQVRTKEMDEYAEKGMAAHFAYKENITNSKNRIDQRLELFRNLIESTESLSDIEFQNSFNSEFATDSVYVYTPKGDVLELPLGSTPVDFAYRIHSDVGNKMVGAIVNDSIVPLSYKLSSNDIVNIKTSNTAKPNQEWLNFVKTNHAKNKIKAYFSKQEKDKYIEKGRAILQSELRKKHFSFDEVLSQENIQKICKELKIDSLEEIYFSIGTLRYTVSYILGILSEEKKEDTLVAKILSNPKMNTTRSTKDSVLVHGKSGMLVNLARCCHPVIGDEIVGYVTKGEGVTVHKANCVNINMKSERLIPVSWNENSSQSYETILEVTCDSNKNYLLDILAKSSGKNIFVVSVKTSETHEWTLYDLSLKIDSLESLEQFINALYQYKFVKNVKRK